jgi:translation initiation factor 3 subunit F
MTSTSDASAALLFDDAMGGAAAATAISSEHSSAATRVIVHPLVLLHVLDHHTRRQEESGRVIGTLLGRRDGSTVEVTNCFAVPHAERGDEVAIGKDFNKRMLSLYLRSNRRETVVGWYASTAAAATTDGSNSNAVVVSTDLVTDTSSLIHEFYAGECDGGDPVHLVIDTRLVTDRIAIRAYKSTPIIVQGEPLGNLFHELRLDLQSTEPETICVHEMMALEKKKNVMPLLDVTASSTNGNTSTVTSSSDGEKDPSVALCVSVEKLYTLLEQTLAYVDSVVGNKNGAVVADPEVGRQLADALASVPRIRPQVFDALFRESLQDLLMVTYLSNVTRTQLTIAEKLNASLGV